MKNISQTGRQIFAKHISEKRTVSKIYKELLKPYSNNPIKNLAKELNRHLTKEDTLDGKQAYEKIVHTVYY